MKWLILIFGVAANASVSALVEMAMLPLREFPSLFHPMAALANGPFWLGRLLIKYRFT